jgi:hypothetical protein
MDKHSSLFVLRANFPNPKHGALLSAPLRHAYIRLSKEGINTLAYLSGASVRRKKVLQYYIQILLG